MIAINVIIKFSTVILYDDEFSVWATSASNVIQNFVYRTFWNGCLVSITTPLSF
jgi:hypothetical protein